MECNKYYREEPALGKEELVVEQRIHEELAAKILKYSIFCA